MALATSGFLSVPLQLASGALLGTLGRNVDVEASKRRCVERYKLDAAIRQNAICLTAREIAEHREPFGGVLDVIAEELDSVASPLSTVGFGASFSNMAGTILYYRSDRAAGHYVDAEREGALWAEGIAGTNGVGTCIAEQRPARIFGSQHFFRHYAHLSCTAVPVHSADGEMFGALNFCSANPSIQQETFHLVSALVQQTAARLNNQLFRIKYAGHIILRARSANGPLLLTLDRENRMIGANLLARHWLGLTEGLLQPINIATMFEGESWLEDIAAHAGDTVSLRVQGNEVNFKVVPVQLARTSPSPNSRAREGLTAPRLGTKQPATPGAPTIEDCLGTAPGASGQAAILRRLSGSRLPILLLGETGTGKDTLARALQMHGQRRNKPFVAFNCAAVPETLIDSELFGYSAGAFTGARREGNDGRLLEADGGTLFLDEIGDMPLALQTRLLRVLESGEVSPLGSGKTRVVDIQVIAATNQQLASRMKEGTFRADLYHRLSGVVVNMTPLRFRNDKQDLIRKILCRIGVDKNFELCAAALERLNSYQWPGNIRELNHVLQRAVQLCDNGVITVEDLLLDRDGRSEDTIDLAGNLGEQTHNDTARAIRFAAERSAFIECLRQNDGDILRTARALQISRATLYRKMKKYR